MRIRKSKPLQAFERASGRAHAASMDAWDATERGDKNASRYHELARDANLLAADAANALGSVELEQIRRETAERHASIARGEHEGDKYA